MMPRQARRLLVVAFALSLLLHLIFAVAWHRPNYSQQGATEIVSIEHRSALITRMQTPPPRPKITPVPHPAPSSRPAPKSSRGTQPSNTGGASLQAGARPAPASTPVIAATTGNACTRPNAGPAIVASAAPPEIAPDTRAEGTSGIALVKVQLDATGNITTAAVAQSTGNSSLDLVAVAMARDARYAPALRDCKPVAGDYTYSVKFVAW